jgi:SAM-dependent methyltransferase
MATGYIHTFTKKEQQRLIHQAEYLIPWIHRHIDYSTCKSVLEIGCGVGAQLRILSRRFPSTCFTGVEFSPELIGNARMLLREEIASGQVTLVEGSAYELPLNAELFDGVFFCWVLEHLADPAKAMVEAVRVLKRDGVLYATEVFNAGVYTYPLRVALMEYWKHFNQLQSDFGGHPDIGIQLANLALEAGLVDVELDNVSPLIDKCQTSAERTEMACYFRDIFASGAEELIAKCRITPALIERMSADFDAIATDLESVMVYTAYQLRAVKP